MDTNAYSVVALVEFLAPGRFIDVLERLALRNAGDARLRRGVTQLARLEGLTFLWIFETGKSVPTGSRRLLGALGLVMLLAPGRMIDFALRAGYANAGDIAVRRGVGTATRLVGLVYVLAALGIVPRDREERPR
ncbi:MAG: hypothetical protein ACQEQY_03200 [Halobacteriota archaeon]